MWHVWEAREVRTGFGGETWEKETTWKDLSIDGRIILKWKLIGLGLWTGLICQVARFCELGNETPG